MVTLWFGVIMEATAGIHVACPTDATPRARLAAAEIVRYVYLRTGDLPALGETAGDDGWAIVLAQDSSRLGPQQFDIKTIGKRVTITGGDDLGMLYGSYRFCEALGVRFYLHGDVIPDERLVDLPAVNETGKPLFGLRGVNPWGSHPFGFDAWGVDDYKAVFSQLAKMRMNFLGIHCYPEDRPYAEPTVWVGVGEDFDAQGKVKFSYPSHYYNTLVNGFWGPILPKKTSDYRFGGALLFDDDAWAPEVMRGYCPLPVTPEACNDVFNRMAVQFRGAFGFARELGVKTCVGTEAPMIMPKAVRQRLQQLGRDPNDQAVVRGVYEAMFRRIAASHPLDYFWLWTPEDWTWGGNNPQQYASTVRDVKLAMEALKASGATFQLATCGWVLGPQHDRAAFDNDLPKGIPMSSISRKVGYTEIDPAYGKIQGREKWAIPWLESDEHHGLSALQPFVGRMRRDAADALAYGCTGLMGLHWRTDILAPNISALAGAAWDQSGWNPAPGKVPAGTERDLPCADFYADWARSNFGAAAGTDVGRVFAAVDGRLPASVAGGCPSGVLTADPEPWARTATKYACVTELEQLRSRVHGVGNLARFDDWLNTFRYHRSLHQVRCTLGEFDRLLKDHKPDAALEKYQELVAVFGETYRLLLATVNSPGGLASVVNLENHAGFWPMVIEEPARRLAAVLGRPLANEVRITTEFQGEPRIIVPTVRSVIGGGESLVLTFMVLDNQPAKSVTISWRPLGQGEFNKLPAEHVARSVYRVTLPRISASFEYWLEAETAGGKALAWPATAPAMNQTVIVW